MCCVEIRSLLSTCRHNQLSMQSYCTLSHTRISGSELHDLLEIVCLVDPWPLRLYGRDNITMLEMTIP